MKKILVLGGKPIGSYEIVKRAKELGYYTIVSDYLPKNESAGKLIADEVWDYSTADIDILEKECVKSEISGVIAGVHEFNIKNAITLCERLNLNTFCSLNQWDLFNNKEQFKQLCLNNGINVAKKYSLQHIENGSVSYPVAVKPVDGSGSRGFHKCNNREEVMSAVEDAVKFSDSGRVIVEQFMPYDSVIIHYTIVNGNVYYCGMSDKVSKSFENTKAPVMGFQSFPSKLESKYISLYNQNAKKMFSSLGLKNGFLWIEAFTSGEDFFFNEMGYRFGGSLTYYPVEYFTGFNQLDFYIRQSVGDFDFTKMPNYSVKEKYCIIPIHIKPGVIKNIEGEKDVLNIAYSYVPVHFEGDEIKAWGSAQQVFCYLHFSYLNFKELYGKLVDAIHILKAKNENDENMLYTLYDIENVKTLKD